MILVSEKEDARSSVGMLGQKKSSFSAQPSLTQQFQERRSPVCCTGVCKRYLQIFGAGASGLRGPLVYRQPFKFENHVLYAIAEFQASGAVRDFPFERCLRAEQECKEHDAFEAGTQQTQVLP